MKLTEMINELNTLLETYGDLELHTLTDEGDNAPIRISLENNNCINFYE